MKKALEAGKTRLLKNHRSSKVCEYAAASALERSAKLFKKQPALQHNCPPNLSIRPKTGLARRAKSKKRWAMAEVQAR